MADDWQSQYEARKAQELTQAKAAIRKACDVLTRLQVKTVTIEYDGEGDSGSVQDITLDPEPAAGLPEGLRDLIENAAYEFLPGGWEINDGSFGTLEIDVATRKVERDHNWRVIETESEGEEFDL